MSMEDKYEEGRIPIIKQIPQSFGRYLYTPYCIGYFSAVLAGMMFLRYKSIHLTLHRSSTYEISIYCPSLGYSLDHQSIRKIQRYNECRSVNEGVVSHAPEKFSLNNELKEEKTIFDRLFEG